MKRYTVKIGEVYLMADRPISEADRERALELLRKRSNAPVLYATDGIEVSISLSGVRNG